MAAVTFFFSLLDITALNAYSIYCMQNHTWLSNNQDWRKYFLFELANLLIKKNVEERSRNLTGLQKTTVLAMENVLGRSLVVEVPRTSNIEFSRGRCYKCVRDSRSKKRKYNETKM